MDQFTADYLANLTAELSARLVEAAGRRVRESISGSESQQAVARCVQAGVVALLTTSIAQAKDEIDLLADIFGKFFDDPDVAAEFSPILRGKPLDIEELEKLFEDAGYVAETLPGLDFKQGIAAFEGAFLAAATQEPSLQGIIQTNQMLAQTALQRDMLAVMRELVAFLRIARPGSIGIQADRIVAENVVSGVQIIYQWPGQAPPPLAGDALAAYRRVVANTCAHLPLRGLDKSASDPTATQKPIRLANVYIDLNTATQVELSEDERARASRKASSPWIALARPLGALEAVVAHRRAVLTGDPGGGKSTFVNHLAYCLTASEVEPGVDWLSHLPGWPAGESGALPIVAILRDFVRGLPSPLPDRAEPTHLWDFIEKWLRAKDLTGAIGAVRTALERGQALILLDGLDEVPTVEQRVFVRDAIAAFVDRHHPDNRYLATCRTLSYQPPTSDDKPDLRLPGFTPFELAKFDSDQIDHFIAAWYTELSRLGTVRSEDTADLIAQLREAVKRPDLWRLAPNPLLLTVMALVHAHTGRLPDARAKLYDEAIDMLLWRWERIRAHVDMPVLLQLLMDAGRTDVDLKRVLSQLAFDVHAQVGDGDDRDKLADIDEMALIRSLSALNHDDYAWARRITEMMKLRAGLLLERDIGVFTFPHRTFQEYLAGAHLAAQNDFALQACRLAERGALWREPILLAVGRLVYQSGETDRPLALVGELCPAQAQDDEADWRKAWLAGDALLEIGVNRVSDSALGRDLLDRVRHRLKDLVTGGRLPPRERVEAGNTLGRLGDPRFRADAWHLPDDLLLGFVEISAGPFTMGTQAKDIPSLMKRFGGERNRYEDEVPQHSLQLPRFFIARYPVTVAQFRAFVAASGYKPEVEVSLRGLPNHPVVSVTWYDAMAYCDWLTDALKKQDDTPEPVASLLRGGKWRVTLPSEAEWEKAARGDRAWNFPWGDHPDPIRANFDETGINTTSPVGCFPDGASPYGMLDLSGNVWEWTRSIYGKYRYDPKDGREELDSRDPRVLRGGAFLNEVRSVRCAARNGYNPDFRAGPLGFRVVVSPL